tara:strand:+ start:80 stop:508 length:429 start_codon:yes stop_codon:yes gene_type:complete
MTTVNQKFITRIGGLSFTSESSYTGEYVTTINGTFTVATGSTTDIPISIEDTGNNDIQLICFKSSLALTHMKLVATGGSTVVYDLKTLAGGGGNILADTTYQLPGNGLLTATSDNDVAFLEVQSASGTSMNLEFAVLFNKTD